MNNNHAQYDHNGKAIRGFEVIETHPNGEETKKGFFPVAAKDSAYALADNLENAFGGFGTEYAVRVRRYA